MPTPEEIVDAVTNSSSWEARIALIQQIPPQLSGVQRTRLFAAIAQRVYVPHLVPDFAYVHWRQDYKLETILPAYEQAYAITQGFNIVDVDGLSSCITSAPITLRIFRLLIGYTVPEFAAATGVMAELRGLRAIGDGRVKAIEAGGAARMAEARICGEVIDRTMAGTLLPVVGGSVQFKIEKPDTRDGWQTVRHYAAAGVPLPVFLHQRYYGGAFRQLLDATSGQRGNVLEDAVEQLFVNHGVQFMRTRSGSQAEIERRFGITISPLPDFLIIDATDRLYAILECKVCNDGGTARDKASRFEKLKSEAERHKVPLFAVLAGLGWKRTRDGLGPVIRDTDGRTFTIPTLDQLMTVQPLSLLAHTTLERDHD